MQLPKKVVVKSRVSSRYDHLYSQGVLKEGERPMRWENRLPGVDVVLTSDGSELSLLSDGQQSPPASGWTVMLTAGNPDEGFEWTLYGLPRD